jgi:Flp pilus assembly protein protease CpaA
MDYFSDLQILKVMAKLWTLLWLLLISKEDMRSFTIPNLYTLAILAAAPFLSHSPLKLRFLACVLPAVLIPFMGMGDIKLFSVLGFCLGPTSLLYICAGSMLCAGLYAAVLLALKRVKRKDRIAFGPFIAAAAIVLIFFPLFQPS